jgi:penicillin-binding protein 1A
MQVARNVYLSSEKTYTRKIYEILLTFKLEHLLSKDQILEIYMNQIFLGNRAYGFAAASEAYFGKPLKDISIAEAAMLAGLPKAPSAYNPISNPRARARASCTSLSAWKKTASSPRPRLRPPRRKSWPCAPTQATSRSMPSTWPKPCASWCFAQYGDEAYTRGLNVYTTLKAADQEAAYKALRKGIMDLRAPPDYRGPEKFVDLPADAKEQEDAIDDAWNEHPDNGDVHVRRGAGGRPQENLRRAPERRGG